MGREEKEQRHDLGLPKRKTQAQNMQYNLWDPSQTDRQTYEHVCAESHTVTKVFGATLERSG